MNRAAKVFPENLRQFLLIEPPPRYACQACNAVTYLDEGKLETWDIGLLAFGDGLACEQFLITCHSCKTPIFTVVISAAAKLPGLPIAPLKVELTEVAAPKVTKLTPADILAGRGKR